MLFSINELFNEFWNLEYKWFIIGGLGLIILMIIIFLCVPKKKKQERINNDLDKIEDNESVQKQETDNKDSDDNDEKTKQKTDNKELNESQIENKQVESINDDSPSQEEIKTKKFDGEKNVVESKKIGKWIIKRKSLDDFVLYLVASNGEIILTSESYRNIPGATLGLKTLKKNIDLGRFQIHSDKNEHYYFKLKDSSNKLLGLGQVYTTKKQCNSSISSVKRFSQNAELIKEVYDDMTYIEYTSKDETINIENIKEAYKGKWIISNNEIEYQAKLYASNGEVLLVTERYASINSVYNAIETIKNNVAINNFIIDSDKNKKYFYRLRNSLKLTLCIGEAYDNKNSCINSIESVKRFCLTADIFEESK